RKDDEERVALHVRLAPAVASEDRTQQLPVARQQRGVAVAALEEEARRPLHVGEQKGERSPRARRHPGDLASRAQGCKASGYLQPLIVLWHMTASAECEAVCTSPRITRTARSPSAMTAAVASRRRRLLPWAASDCARCSTSGAAPMDSSS